MKITSGRDYASLLAETFLRSALESVLVIKSMDAGGRTELSTEDKAKLQGATDTAAAAARLAGADL